MDTCKLTISHKLSIWGGFLFTNHNELQPDITSLVYHQKLSTFITPGTGIWHWQKGMGRVDELGPKNISQPQLWGTPFHCTEEEWSERNHFLPHLTTSHIERGGGRRRKRKKRAMFVQTSNTVQILSFPGSKTGLTFKIPFPFMSSLWFRNRQFWVVCFLMPIAQVISHNHPFWSMEFIQKSWFHGSPYSNEINIHNKTHCCFPGLVFAATSWCFHTFQIPSQPANHKKITVTFRKRRRGLTL